VDNCHPDETQQADCCAQSECCPSPGASAAPGATACKKWKTAVFVAVLLLAAGVAAHALLTRPAGGPTLSTSSGSERPTGASSGAGLSPFEDLGGAFAEHDFVFVVLPGTDNGSASELARPVAEAAARVRARGVGVGTFVLGRDNAEFAKAVDLFAVEGFPAVLALKKGCGQAVVHGEITETKLLRAYLEACAASPSCGPGPCCP